MKLEKKKKSEVTSNLKQCVPPERFPTPSFSLSLKNFKSYNKKKKKKKIIKADLSLFISDLLRSTFKKKFNLEIFHNLKNIQSM